jgi:DNA polymerase III subunit epsilon
MTGAALVVDCETTGLGPDDRIVSLALLWLDDDLKPRDEGSYWEFSPGRPSHPKAFEKHRLGDAYLAVKPSFAAHAAEIHAAITAAPFVVAHNVDFDMRFLDREFSRAGLTALRPAVFCTMAEFGTRWPGAGRSLDAAAARFDLARVSERHDAREDALLAGALFRRLRIEAAFDAAKRAAAPGTRTLRKNMKPSAGPAHRIWSPPPERGAGSAGPRRVRPEPMTILVTPADEPMREPRSADPAESAPRQKPVLWLLIAGAVGALFFMLAR